MVVNIDNVSHQDGLFHPMQELVGDIGPTLQALTPLLKACAGWNPADLATFRQQQRPTMTPSGTRLSPAAALRIMRDVLPRETILTTDAGQHKVYASRLWECYQPLDYLTSSGLGTMGVAIPIAIATKLVRRHRPVVALTGHALSGTKKDAGELLRYLQDLSTGVAAGVAAGRSLTEIQKTLTLDAYKGFERWDTVRNDHIAAVYATLRGTSPGPGTR
jgi:hypothetical protein